MKINVIGAGPAGLYFATHFKQRNPSHEVTIYERDSNTANGLGYTLAVSMVQLLLHLDRDACPHLEKLTTGKMESLTTLLNSRYLYETEFREPVFGIKRRDLIEYMTNLAIAAGVNIHYGVRMSEREVGELRKTSDVLVGADGVNSEVRKLYSQEFGARSVEGTNRHIWLSSPQIYNHLIANLRDVNGNILFSHSYPLPDSSAVIVECTKEGFSNLHLDRMVTSDGSISKDGIKTIEGLLSGPFGFQLQSKDSRWFTTKVNSCDRIASQNVALIGDAGFSLHYSTGGGIFVAFAVAKSLSDKLSEGDLDHAMETFNEGVQSKLLQSSNSRSLQHMEWLETIDVRYSSMNELDFFNSFLFKNG
jgi:2-polyprenyl-6-methoxyphenol hydroxylase-like FAD-dependent oxidoreductase